MIFFKKTTFSLIAKVLIFGFLILLLYQQLFLKSEFEESIDAFRASWSDGNQSLWIIIIFLMVINWSLESMKWKAVLQPLQNISFAKALEGVLLGITFSLFTPNRMGEFGGRILALKKQRMSAIVATLIGSLSQIVINVTLGGLAFIGYLLFMYFLDIYYHTLVIPLSALIIVLMLISIYLYFNLDRVALLIHKIRFLKRYENYTQIPDLYKRSDLLQLLFYSALRYLIYCLQFFLMLKLFGIHLDPIVGMILVATIYFIQTILPTYALLEIGVRGNVAVFILKSFTANVLGIFTATMSLWLVNLVVPGIIGACLAFTVKFFISDNK